MKKTLYDILRVAQDASADDIARAYQDASEKLQTADKHDANALIAVREAFQVLSNTQRRAAYDASLASRAAPALSRSTFEDDESRSSGHMKWIIGLVLVAGILIWWQTRKPETKPPPPVATQASTAQTPTAMQIPSQAAQPSRVAVGNQARTPEELYAELAGSIARINTFNAQGNQLAIGSGVVIGNGVVVTNCHVTQGASQIQVRIGGDALSASIATADEEFDLCKLNVAGLRARPVNVGSVNSVRTGQKVYAIGAPLGLDLTISEGIVSSLRQTDEGTIIQTTAPISPGSSGGGLFDPAGQLIGIVTFQTRSGQNLNFAVPADWIGSMRTRTVSAGSSMPNVSPVEGARKPDDAAEKLVGTWVCFSPVTGRNVELSFYRDRRVTGIMEGKAIAGQYQVNGRLLMFYGGASGGGTIEDLSDNKYILILPSGNRVACNRK
ncbi:MAG: trypsin-like peptidase domain-containing protein [Burkholderiales bacterium]|nr:trypsin-like peptidase domain-containing protein [Burkholderiales bacterium]